MIIFNPVVVNSAEILQIKSSNTILVGDQNRNLTIGLFCVDVNENDEIEATNLLKSEFPRGSKVKIKPFGFKEKNLNQLDLKRSAFRQLLNENIPNTNIDISNLCTYKLKNEFNSWRRSKTISRQWNFICS